jgi:ribosomal-protein-alanine N-acetyltransferase
VALDTERLTLRRPRPDDLDQYCARIYGDPAVMRMLPGGRPLPLPEARVRAQTNLLEHWERHGFGPWLVIERASGQLIGHCGLRFWPETTDVEVLYALVPDAWGKGYATEAARRAAASGFESLALGTLIAGADVENAGSIRVLGKLGMRPWQLREFHGLKLQMFRLDCAEWTARSTGDG